MNSPAIPKWGGGGRGFFSMTQKVRSIPPFDHYTNVVWAVDPVIISKGSQRTLVSPENWFNSFDMVKKGLRNTFFLYPCETHFILLPLYQQKIWHWSDLGQSIPPFLLTFPYHFFPSFFLFYCFFRLSLQSPHCSLLFDWSSRFSLSTQLTLGPYDLQYLRLVFSTWTILNSCISFCKAYSNIFYYICLVLYKYIYINKNTNNKWFPKK